MADRTYPITDDRWLDARRAEYEARKLPPRMWADVIREAREIVADGCDHEAGTYRALIGELLQYIDCHDDA